MTLGEIKTALKRFGFDDDDPLTAWINEAYRQFLDAYQWPFLEAISSEDTVVGVDSLNLPADFFSMITARITTASTNLEYMGRIQFENEIQDPTKTGKPTIYTLVGMDGLVLYPIPDAVYTVRYYYKKFMSPLVDDIDVPFIGLSYYHYTLVQGAAAVGLQAENEEDRASTALENFSSGIATAIAAFGTKQTGEYGQVRDTQGYGRC